MPNLPAWPGFNERAGLPPELKCFVDALDESITNLSSLSIEQACSGSDAFSLAIWLRHRRRHSLSQEKRSQPADLIWIVQRREEFAAATAIFQFVCPCIEIIEIPAWDIHPYDGASPNRSISGTRMESLWQLTSARSDIPRVILTTANAWMQRVPETRIVRNMCRSLEVGMSVSLNELSNWCASHGFERVDTVRVQGEYGLRGGIVDIFSAAHETPLRLDFFGDEIESIREFDSGSQRTIGKISSSRIISPDECPLDEPSIQRFRQRFVATFGAAQNSHSMYHAVSAGQRVIGMEHLLPLFHEKLDTLAGYLPEVPAVLTREVRTAMGDRWDTVSSAYHVRKAETEANQDGTSMPVLPAGDLHLDPYALELSLSQRPTWTLTPFRESEPDLGPHKTSISIHSRPAPPFSAPRQTPDANLFDAVSAECHRLAQEKYRIIVGCWSAGSMDRMSLMLSDHGVKALTKVSHLDGVHPTATALSILPIERGFILPGLAVISEQDILGQRLVRPNQRKSRAEDLLADINALSPGDRVVHIEHGIGLFNGIRSLSAAGAVHDCLEISYAGDDKLFVPVENLELLSRVGPTDANASLDRLGGAGWQTRKARVAKRIRDIASKLIQTAAERVMNDAPPMVPPEEEYLLFCAAFPFEETPDQRAAIDQVLSDFSGGQTRERLICGDVGFGKTEVALRASFVAAMNGRQVALLVPTTLLARQHMETFRARFQPYPVQVAQASRLTSPKELKRIREGLADGTIDIVIGTHALLSKSISFRDIGLLIIDEEQHFGVSHKEKLKTLKEDIHVLSLSATPIPRTLQFALSGLRELSLIATAPLDRLAVQTSVLPFDSITIREALMREKVRGGQSFYVCPRISDMAGILKFIAEKVPELAVTSAHGQMPARALDEAMSDFYQGKTDVLISTNIIESGLDVPRANTLIVHRSDRFGLSQLYQLRGRVGRSKRRAFAFLTLPPDHSPTPQARKRLELLQSFTETGSGFQLASHDMDIRGTGNLLGEEQTGHIREVGFELYQKMLTQAVVALKENLDEKEDDTLWSPQIELGIAARIPEKYIPDLALRLRFYRSLASVESLEELHAHAAEMIDRFGPLPGPAKNLMRTVTVKVLCRKARIERVEAGPRGLLIRLRNNRFRHPDRLAAFVSMPGQRGKVRSDHAIFFSRDWSETEFRLREATNILRDVAELAG